MCVPARAKAYVCVVGGGGDCHLMWSAEFYCILLVSVYRCTEGWSCSGDEEESRDG